MRIHQNVLDGLASPAGAIAECLRVEIGRQRFRAQTCETRMRGEIVAPQHEHHSEAARILKTQLGAVVQTQNHVRVREQRRRVRQAKKTAAHPQMHDQDFVSVQIQQQVLRPPAHLLDAVCNDALTQHPRGDRGAQPAVPHVYPDDRPAR
jgi:hypothetical protein